MCIRDRTKATIKKGKTFKIKASEIKMDKKIRRHRVICYESSNTKIATVNSKGKVKGVDVYKRQLLQMTVMMQWLLLTVLQMQIQ